jgi:hypothetical protein
VSESEMSESAAEQPEPSGENGGREFRRERDETDRNWETAPDTEGLFSEIERFARLSSGLKDCLAEIVCRMKDAVEGLDAIEQAVERGKSELKQVRDIEASAAVLDDLEAQHRARVAEFESTMEKERHRWEEEKARKEKENGEYEEALRLRRHKEEEEYLSEWAGKQAVARKEFEENLNETRRQRDETLKAREDDLLRREQALREKEAEYERLVRELEVFMNELVASVRKKQAGASGSGEQSPQCTVSAQENLSFDSAMPGVRLAGEERTGAAGTESDMDEDPSITTLRKALSSQSGNIHNLRENGVEKRDPLPFRIPSSSQNQ